jgi:hypothetical protein
MTTHTTVEIRGMPTGQTTLRPRNPTADYNGAVAQLLALQRSAGNQAVARRITGLHTGWSPPAITPTVQRCGPVPCDCSPEERADYAANNSQHTTPEHESDPNAPAAADTTG